jgi:hypothetical protein
MQLNVGGTANLAVADGNLPPVSGSLNRSLFGEGWARRTGGRAGSPRLVFGRFRRVLAPKGSNVNSRGRQPADCVAHGFRPQRGRTARQNTTRNDAKVQPLQGCPHHIRHAHRGLAPTTIHILSLRDGNPQALPRANDWPALRGGPAFGTEACVRYGSQECANSSGGGLVARQNGQVARSTHPQTAWCTAQQRDEL